MALKPIYLIDGQRWMPIGRAAEMLATNAATIKRMIGDGRLEWHQVPGGSTLLVAEAGVQRLRLAPGALDRVTARRAAAPSRTAAERGKSMLDVPPSTARVLPARGPGVFERTWDPRTQAAPVPGRTPSDKKSG